MGKIVHKGQTQVKKATKLSLAMTIAFFFIMPRYPSNKSPSFTQNIESIHNQVHISYLTNYVLMCSWQFELKQVNDQMSKVSNKI
jgi:hypothetical protein